MRRTIMLSISLGLAILCLIGTPMPRPALAQEYVGDYAGRFSFTFSPGVLFGDTLYEGRTIARIPYEIEIDDGFLYLFRGEYAFTDRIAVEVNIGGSTNEAEGTMRNFTATLMGETSSTESMEWDGNLFLFSANVVYQYPMDSIVPFVTVGLGLVKWSMDLEMMRSQVDTTTLNLSDIEAAGYLTRDLLGYDETDLDVNFGGGLKFHVTENTVVRIDVRDHVVFPEDSDFFGDAETLHMIEVSGGISYVW